MGLVTMTGLVLAAFDVGDFDRRLVILTKERGKITAFAKGARRPHNNLVAASHPFCFGEFEAYEGKNSYHLIRADISNYFRNLATDYEKVCLGSYFLEMAEYYALEEIEEKARLALLYQSLKALESGRFSLDLLKGIYELRSWVIDGEYPEVFCCVNCNKKEKLIDFSVKHQGMLCDSCAVTESGIRISNSTLYAMQYIVSSPIEKLYTFVLNEDTQKELTRILSSYRVNYKSHKFKSEDFL